MSDSTKPTKPDLSRGIPVADLSSGALVAGTFQGKDIVVARSGAHYFAVDAQCTHLGAPLSDGIVVEGGVHCPWHHARFDLGTGEATAAPALRPLGCYSTSVRGDTLFVTGSLRPPARVATGEDTRRVVIIGAGAAGHACAEMLARKRYGGPLLLVSDDPDGSYDRTQCSKQYLTGESQRAQTLLDLPASVRRITGEASALDVHARTVRVAGDKVPFDVLVLATGARPIRPSLGDGAPVHVLRTLRDADAILEQAKGAKSVAVLGSSFIGLEVAASLRQKGLEVDVIAPGAVPLARVMGAEVGQMVRRVHEEKGIRFHLGRHAQHYDGTHLHLDHGGLIAADLMVAGIGVQPNTELASAAGLTCSAPPLGGVLVDGRLETSISGIFAVGDIAAYPDVHSGKLQRVEHWTHAQRQGQFVARAILGQASRFADVPFFWSAHYDVGLTYEGHVDAIAGTEQEGSIEARDFTLRLTGIGAQKALIACNRDLASLLVEASWDHALTSVD